MLIIDCAVNEMQLKIVTETKNTKNLKTLLIGTPFVVYRALLKTLIFKVFRNSNPFLYIYGVLNTQYLELPYIYYAII